MGANLVCSPDEVCAGRDPMPDVKPVRGPVHVLFVVDLLHGAEFAKGSAQGLAGVEAALLRIVQLLPRPRYRCSVATFSLGEKVGGVEHFPCPLHVFPLRRTYDWNALKVAAKLRNLIRSEQVSIVHTFLETSDIFGGLIAKMSGCPILVSSRRDMGVFRLAKHRLAYRLVNRLVDQVQTVSDEVRAYTIRSDGLDPRKVVTLYNGVELERFTATNGTDRPDTPLELPQGSHLITTVANIRPVKGIDILIQTAAIVCREFPRARFLVVGKVLDPQHFDNLQQMIRSLGLTENVIFSGPSDRVPALLRTSDVFCMLSRSEGFSNAILEAMASGLPCVVTRVGGNGEAVEEGRSGFLVKNEDFKTTADRILTLLRQPERAKRMGQEGQRIVASRFTAQAMVNELVKLYDRLLEGRQA